MQRPITPSPRTFKGGEQRAGAVPDVIVGHCAATSLLHGQPGLGAVERLDLALFVDRQDDGMGGWVDIETDDVAQLGGELGIVGQLELTVTGASTPQA